MAAWTMAASREKYRGRTRSALKVSRKTWFHSRTTFAARRQRASSGSRDNLRRAGCVVRVRGARRRGGRDLRSPGQSWNNMVALLLEGGLRQDGEVIVPGAQTERRGDAGAVRGL